MATPQHTLNLARLSYHASHLANSIHRRLIEYKIEHAT
jgi:hypothetical protein